MKAKKVLAFLMSSLLVLSITSCNNSPDNTSDTSDINSTSQQSSKKYDFDPNNNQSFQLQDMSFNIPHNWKKEPAESGFYFYPPSGGMLYVYHLNMTADLNNTEHVQLLIDGFNSNDELVLKNQADIQTINNMEFHIFDGNTNLDEEIYRTKVAFVNSPSQTMGFMMSYNNNDHDYNTDFQKILESVSFSTSSSEQNSEYETELTAGQYTVATDIPAGTYDIEALSGSGNLISSRGILNEIMSSAPDENSTNICENIKLSTNTVLQVFSNLKIKISSKDAEINNINPRTNNLTETINLNIGNYIAGTDFPAGTYDIICLSGTSSIFGGSGYHIVSETLSANNIDPIPSITHYKNATFEAGNKIKIEKLDFISNDDVTIQLVPSKA